MIADLGLRIANTRCSELKRVGMPLVGVRLLLTLALLLVNCMHISHAADWAQLKSLIGPQDAIVVADPAGRIIIAEHAQQKLVPASILKIFTSLAALHYLGPSHRM